MMMNPQIPFGIGSFNGLIEYRAQVQAYANDFCSCSMSPCLCFS